MYPKVFKRLLAHPDWLHTDSFNNGTHELMPIWASVHVKDPNEARPIPEPASIADFAMIAIGIGVRSRRKRKGCFRE